MQHSIDLTHHSRFNYTSESQCSRQWTYAILRWTLYTSMDFGSSVYRKQNFDLNFKAFEHTNTYRGYTLFVIAIEYRHMAYKWNDSIWFNKYQPECKHFSYECAQWVSARAHQPTHKPPMLMTVLIPVPLTYVHKFAST